MGEFSLSSVVVSIKKSAKDFYDITIGKLIDNLFSEKSTILFLGIDNAGKTTLVNKLKDNKNHVFLPTKHAKREFVQIGKLKAAIMDIGGHRAARIAWKDYFYKIDGVIFIVDTHDQKRFDEVKESWNVVKSLSNGVPILVFMNKIDKLNETSETVLNNIPLMHKLEFECGILKDNNVEVRYLSITKESTFDEESVLYKSFQWLSNKIKNSREKNKRGSL